MVTTGTNARLPLTVGIIAMVTAAVVGLVSMVTGKTVWSKVRRVLKYHGRVLGNAASCIKIQCYRKQT